MTSFCCFKYMSLYSAIQFTTVSFLYASASNLGDFQVPSLPCLYKEALANMIQFLFIDLLLILPIAIFSKSFSESVINMIDTRLVGWTGSYTVLSQKKPTASLVSRKVLTPLLGQVIICILIQLIGYEVVQRQTWFVIFLAYAFLTYVGIGIFLHTLIAKSRI